MNSILVVLGMLCSLFLFVRFRRLPPGGQAEEAPAISVIIPARNEADTLPLLLGDLTTQTHKAAEIICVDDDSSDATAQVAKEHGATVLTLRHKPPGWTGKAYACQAGARAAKSELLLFLDADVRLAPGALQSLAAAHGRLGCTIAVQPYHTALRWHEQLSLFFSLIAAAALGSRLPFGIKTRGLFGPVILILAQVYHAAGGHAGVKAEVLEDIALGRALDESGQPYQCFLGGQEIRFRMYAAGLRPLVEGWTKNFATGAFRSSWLFLAGVIAWMSALCIIPARLAVYAVDGQWASALLYAVFYLCMVGVLLYGSATVGQFKVAAIVCYPVCLLFFVLLFLCSLYKKVFHRPVRWKGRDI